MGQSQGYTERCSADAPHIRGWHSEDQSGREGTVGESQSREEVNRSRG